MTQPPKKPRGRPRKHPPGSKQYWWVCTPEEAARISRFLAKQRKTSPK